MITISLTNLGKRFNTEWIFRNLTKQFISGRSYAITGANGSGKSTLLQIIAGSTMLSEGTVVFSLDGNLLPESAVFRHVSLTAPYLDVIEEMTLNEFFNFHTGLKPWLPGITTKEIIAMCGLENAASKQIRYYSSGMKQRVKLAQAIFSDTSVLLLDEPSSNLDEMGIQLYNSLLQKFTLDRIVIIASNDRAEYSTCDEVIELRKF